MNNLLEVFATARGSMAKADSVSVSELFNQEFSLKEGDYVEYADPNKRRVVKVRILAIDECYLNKNSGYTSHIRVARFLHNGKIGTGRGMTLVISKNLKLHTVTQYGNSVVKGAKE